MIRPTFRASFFVRTVHLSAGGLDGAWLHAPARAVAPWVFYTGTVGPGLGKHIVDYHNASKPVIGLRTATHAIEIKDRNKKFAQFTHNHRDAAYEKGFGRQVLGETWVNHHGSHGRQSTRAITAPGQEQNPILR